MLYYHKNVGRIRQQTPLLQVKWPLIQLYSKGHKERLAQVRKEKRQRTVVWLTQRLSCSRTNVYKIFDKYSVDTDTLARISTILEFDFFSPYSKEIKKMRSKNKHIHKRFYWAICTKSVPDWLTNRGHFLLYIMAEYYWF